MIDLIASTLASSICALLPWVAAAFFVVGDQSVRVAKHPTFRSSTTAGDVARALAWQDIPAFRKNRPTFQSSGIETMDDDDDDGGGGNDDGCKGGALCVGPGVSYNIGRQVGVCIRGEFVVPPLPQTHNDMDLTYYDYINIFWRQNVYPGYMNQFVPQLMLGSALANSTNHPLYEPQWLQLDSWHIGAQYFMAICNNKDIDENDDDDDTSTKTSNNGNNKDCGDDWTAKAATGELIAVEPGEGVFTTFELLPRQDASSSPPAVEWHLTMGVLGDATRVSRLVVPRPFLGLVKGTDSWMEDVYDAVYVGSCLENYGMTQPANYPSFWRIDMDIQLPEDASTQPIWHEWGMDHDRECDWQPKSAVGSTSSNKQGFQAAYWEAWLEIGDMNDNANTSAIK